MLKHKQKLKGALRRYNEDDKVSKINRKYVKDFLKSYNVENTTLAKFYDFIRYFLHETKDAKKSLASRDETVQIFNRLHERLGVNGYATTVSVTKRFARWLFDDEMPKTLNSIKQLTDKEKRKLRRVNNGNYQTITWEEGLKISEATNSIQLKAMLMTELDGGLRPSEFFSLRYGDVKRDEKFIILQLSETKTSEPRNVIIYRAAPYLSRWLELHPLKNDKSPLWLMENKVKSSRYRKNKESWSYDYDSARKLLAKIAKEAGVNKPLYFYNLRHSAIALSKQENMNPDLAAEKFGHSIKFYTETYGRLTEKQQINRYKAHFGEPMDNVSDTKKPKECPMCGCINEPEKTHCEKCNSALSLTVAINADKKKGEELSELKKALEAQQRQIDLILQGPEKLKAAREIAKARV